MNDLVLILGPVPTVILALVANLIPIGVFLVWIHNLFYFLVVYIAGHLSKS
jgi:hypothetical protein